MAFALVCAIRSEMRRRQPAHLSLSQYRALAFVWRKAGTSLSHIAEHLGLSLPSTSKLVHELVTEGLLLRAYDPTNRRVLMINVTPRGAEMLDKSRREALTRLTAVLAALPADELAAISRAMPALQLVVEKLSPACRLDEAVTASTEQGG